MKTKLHVLPNATLPPLSSSVLHSPSPPFPRRPRNAASLRSRNPNNRRRFKMLAMDLGSGWPGIDVTRRGDGEEELDSPVDLSVTHELPPALTFREGLERIKEAVAELKAKPPCCDSGVVRFQIRVPPSTSAVDWFCSKVNLFAVYPKFCISLENNKEITEMTSLDEMTGISGFGAAIYLQGYSYSTEEINLTRYLSVDSPLIRAYGLICNKDDNVQSSANHMNGSYYIFIPQIELDEFGGSSILASTVIWDIHRLHKFQCAVQSVEFYLEKLTCCVDDDIYEKDDLTSIKDAQMVYLHAENLVTCGTQFNSKLVFSFTWIYSKIVLSLISGFQLHLLLVINR